MTTTTTGLDESETEGATADHEVPEDAEPICICCLEPIPHDQVLFCPECGAPIDPLAAYHFFESTLAEGYVLREAAWRPRRLVTLAGIVLMLGIPGLILLFFAIHGAIRFGSLTWEWLLAIPYLLILVQMFRSWIRYRREGRAAS